MINRLARSPPLVTAATNVNDYLRWLPCSNALITKYLSTISSEQPKKQTKPKQPKQQLASTKSRPLSKESKEDTSPERIRELAEPRPDWRQWFRSAEYDDPWSPYYSFLEEINDSSSDAAATSTTANSDESLSTFLGENFEQQRQRRRRRHGMNLEPLFIRFIGYNNSIPSREEAVIASKLNGVDVRLTGRANGEGSTRGAGDEDESAAIARARKKLLSLDRQTRFMCGMLDDLYRSGIRRQTDRPATERCFRTIRRLLQTSPGKPSSQGNVQQFLAFGGLAQRAGAILERMERCCPAVPETYPTKSTDFQDAPNTNSFQSYQRIYSYYPDHLSATKQVLPTPNQSIYSMVLELYAKESGPIRIAQQAEDVLWSMIVRGKQKPLNNVTSVAESFDLTPDVDHWNNVLRCWSISTDADRAFHAYAFLRSWKENNNETSRDNHQGNRTHSKLSEPNFDSFNLVLQACLVKHNEESDADTLNEAPAEIQRSKEIGSGVAIRVWKEMEKSKNIPLNSQMYYQILSAICQTAGLPSTSPTFPALLAVARVFRKCRENDMINKKILRLVKKATTDSQFSQLTGD